MSLPAQADLHGSPLAQQRVIRPQDDEWPHALNELGRHRPPELVHAMGRRLPDPRGSIAIVGTRRPTAAGLQATRQMARACGEAGFAVISGIAVGVDAAAHDETLRADGHTVAVLGCGLDVDYPARNKRLKGQLVQRGTLVSEYSNGEQPYPAHFPERNRIVVGLARAVLVVEGGLKSGALITARLALDADRSIFAVPGSMRNAMAAGPNELIRTGQAALVTDPSHIFDELAPGLVWQERVDRLDPKAPALEAEEIEVLGLLDDVPVTLDHIAQCLGQPLGRTTLALSRLEVRGLIIRRRMGYEITEAGGRVRSLL